MKPTRTAEERVAGVIDAFFDAMHVQDLESVSSLIAHDADMVHIGTDRGERWVGWDTLTAATGDQFASLDSFRVSYRHRWIKLLGAGRVACFSRVMDLETKNDRGVERMEDARLTGVAERRDGRWVLVQTHLSVPGT